MPGPCQRQGVCSWASRGACLLGLWAPGQAGSTFTGLLLRPLEQEGARAWSRVCGDSSLPGEWMWLCPEALCERPGSAGPRARASTVADLSGEGVGAQGCARGTGCWEGCPKTQRGGFCVLSAVSGVGGGSLVGSWPFRPCWGPAAGFASWGGGALVLACSGHSQGSGWWGQISVRRTLCSWPGPSCRVLIQCLITDLVSPTPAVPQHPLPSAARWTP